MLSFQNRMLEKQGKGAGEGVLAKDERCFSTVFGSFWFQEQDRYSRELDSIRG